jgi:CBS domain-containing protein
MPVFKNRGILTGIKVKETMRRNVNRLPADVSIVRCVRTMLKRKSNAVLVDDADGNPVGVVSKTDIMSAYYAGLPPDTCLSDIMAGPPYICYPDDTLEDALDIMQRSGIHRIYVRGADSDEIAGVLAYSDLVGILYRYCRACKKSHRKSSTPEDQPVSLNAKDVMSTEIISCHKDDSISQIIELLAARHLGAVLILDDQEKPKGVISKTDLNLAYIHGVEINEPAKTITKGDVAGVTPETSLSQAIKQMLIRDVQRLFVIDSEQVKGVISLSDVARFRSGTCRACTASRMMQDFA